MLVLQHYALYVTAKYRMWKSSNPNGCYTEMDRIVEFLFYFKAYL